MRKKAIALFACVTGAALAAPSLDNAAVALVSRCKGKTYLSIITRDQLKNMPGWDHEREENPPLSPMKAKASAQKILETLVAPKDIKTKWRFSSTTLAFVPEPEPETGRWYYIVNWSGPVAHYLRREDGKRVKNMTGGHRFKEIHDEFRLIVLMDGTCVKPEEEAPNQSMEPDKQ